MTRYLNLGGDSGVEAYEFGYDYITVYFAKTARGYTYSYRSAGPAHVEAMKQLARNGQGLNEYINRYARYLYER